MNAQEQPALNDILEGCYDVQLELNDLIESYELLIYDIELAIGEISEYLERVQGKRITSGVLTLRTPGY